MRSWDTGWCTMTQLYQPWFTQAIDNIDSVSLYYLCSSQREQAFIVSLIVSLLICLLWQLIWKTRCARCTMDQSDRIYNGKLGIYGNVNHPCPQATPSDSGRFTALNPWPRPITTCIAYKTQDRITQENKLSIRTFHKTPIIVRTCQWDSRRLLPQVMHDMYMYSATSIIRTSFIWTLDYPD